MIQKLKDALNNSFLWLLFLVGCVAYLLRKEKHLEDQLKEQKFDDAIKETKDAQAKIDSNAADSYAEYERLRSDYLRTNPSGLRQGNPGSEKAD